MIQFQVSDMRSSHCVRTVMSALGKVAPVARFYFDIQTKRLRVEGCSSIAALEAAIRAAGYTPARLKM